jgi:hypothetical protein
MEGQDVARLATARGVTDSYAEQGLEAELSVELERKSAPATVTRDARDFDDSRHADRGIRNPHAARESDGSER